MTMWDNKILITYTIEDQGFEEGRAMYIAGMEDAKKGDLGTIMFPKPAGDVNIPSCLPDPVVFSYTNTKDNIIRLRVVLVKIDSDANPQRPSTCTVSVLVPSVDGNWVTRTADVRLVLPGGTTAALLNPHSLVQVGDTLYFIDYESRLIVYVKKDILEAAADNADVPVQILNLGPTTEGGIGALPDNAKGQALIALNQKLYALYICSDAAATDYYPGFLLRLDIDSQTGALSYDDSSQTTVGKNPQSIIPVIDNNGVVQLLIPARGGEQFYNGTTNGTESNICVVQAEAASWPANAPVKLTGDPSSSSSPLTAYDIHAIGAAMRNGESLLFILTQVYDNNAKSARWMLYQTVVKDFLNIPNGTTLTGATQITDGVEFELLDQGVMVTPDPEVADNIYFWDILYEQTLRDDDEEDRLWLLLGSPFLVTKAEAYGSPTKPLQANPFALLSGFGGINVNSVDLIIETLHQAQREVSLKRGARGVKLSIGAGKASVAAATAATGGAAEEEEDK